jgi:hypothetical protein
VAHHVRQPSIKRSSAYHELIGSPCKFVPTVSGTRHSRRGDESGRAPTEMDRAASPAAGDRRRQRGCCCSAGEVKACERPLLRAGAAIAVVARSAVPQLQGTRLQVTSEFLCHRRRARPQLMRAPHSKPVCEHARVVRRGSKHFPHSEAWGLVCLAVERKATHPVCRPIPPCWITCKQSRTKK